MPYVYEVSFDIAPTQMGELEIGQSLERLIGYMKIRLPSQPGFVLADAFYSVDDPATTRIVMRSQWSDWCDVVDHCRSHVVEDQLFQQFEPHVDKDSITVRTYAEVGSGPFTVRR